MCFGEGQSDSFRAAEVPLLSKAASTKLPDYDLRWHRNEDAMTWAVLTPPSSSLPRFTICRIDPCIVVMVEDATDRRRFSSASDIEGAVAFIRQTAEQARLAVHNIHDYPDMAQ